MVKWANHLISLFYILIFNFPNGGGKRRPSSIHRHIDGVVAMHYDLPFTIEESTGTIAVRIVYITLTKDSSIGKWKLEGKEEEIITL